MVYQTERSNPQRDPSQLKMKRPFHFEEEEQRSDPQFSTAAEGYRRKRRERSSRRRRPVGQEVKTGASHAPNVGSIPARVTKLVSMTTRVHPFPFRTRKLSSSVAKILVWRRTGKIARCQHQAAAAKPQLLSFFCTSRQTSIFQKAPNEAAASIGKGGATQRYGVLAALTETAGTERAQFAPTRRRTGKIARCQHQNSDCKCSRCFFISAEIFPGLGWYYG